ncbi:endonuclease/exonuclease/phosphatase family protein [Magnetospirillum sp. UT-4]|uniref:endonuclease/exonuclease/phosphatase family protein n=1 Tax=Magnetospirillum sp. UT-4 TaxID=2681467 RepID=UPI001384D3BC|nr:endonuclease/exonuclease/phosphatase family protein [Magnetospirillum sp. UT-4]CAA7616894.1 conserved hypothetical protein [Magnetospirillum sp. UT-4]
MRVVTLNTWKGDGPYGRRLELMTGLLAGLAADVVALQEVLQAPDLGLDTAAHLARHLDMTPAFLPLRHKRRRIEGAEADSWSGLAVLTRRPLRSFRAVPLPADARDGERAALVAELEGLAVAVVHLTHLADAGELRRRQWRMAAAALGENGDAVIAGDVNAPVEALAPEGSGFADCRTALGLAPQATLVGGGPGDCIDHVLYRIGGALAPVAWSVAPDDGASDHMAVVVDFGHSVASS